MNKKNLITYFLLISVCIGLFMYSSLNPFMKHTRFYKCGNELESQLILTHTGSYVILNQDGTFYKDNYHRTFLRSFRLTDHKDVLIASLNKSIRFKSRSHGDMVCQQNYLNDELKSTDRMAQLIRDHHNHLIELSDLIKNKTNNTSPLITYNTIDYQITLFEKNFDHILGN
ncbi:hypothetical protein EEI45_05920 [Erysipelothrix piscisicarius]|uniref:Uncharacterized protein n=1 Tax=Erysipelothrix piscisicarius TaxID=2485784 RepID=A0A3S8RMY3_9FIRM|nr:hypothetical protein [Erysipelothrix piscisicarius]AZK44342.1 hypothetical protein EEI45_05920 [Erysipelothrix piscisicarius]